MSNNEHLEKISKSLMLKEPFYGLFLIMLNKVWDNKVGTAGVSKNGINYQLKISEDYWNSLNEDLKMGLLKHELLHLCFHHLLLREAFHDWKLFNIAADLEVNQYLESNQVKEDWVHIDHPNFKHLNLDLKQGTRYYYDVLLQAKNNGDPKIEEVYNCLGSGEAFEKSGHDSWEEFSDVDEATKKLIEKQLHHIINEVADEVRKSRGFLPAEIDHLLDKINVFEAPKFNWKGYLRRFAGGSIKVYTKKLRRKFNKRYEDNPGLKIKPKKHILVAVDTSGSVSNNELKEFFQEINHIHRTGTEITVVQCDAAISSIQPFNPRHEIKIHGRGGKLCLHM